MENSAIKAIDPKAAASMPTVRPLIGLTVDWGEDKDSPLAVDAPHPIFVLKGEHVLFEP
jgi:hypothetical protein